MTDTDPGPAAPTAGMRSPDTAPPWPDPAQSFLLVFNDPAAPVAGYGIGWTLTAWRGHHRAWAQPLAARGASVHAGGRIAQAVAVRVLTEHGVVVAGWNAAPHDIGDPTTAQLGAFRARVPITTGRPRQDPAS